MMDQHRSEYFAILSEALHPAFFSIADCLCCPEQRYCNGLILFGCVAIADRAILAVYRENSLGHDSPQKRTLHVEGSKRKYNHIAERHKWDSLPTGMMSRVAALHTTRFGLCGIICSAKPRRTRIGKRDVNKQAATGEDDAGTMLPLAYVSEKDGNSDLRIGAVYQGVCGMAQ